MLPMKKQESVIAYHFVGSKLLDGRPVPKNGVWLKHEGKIKMCKSGLHASLQPFDALQYAPAPILCKVELRGDILRGKDKLVARERKIIARFDATDLLRAFARKCALDVIHLWSAPKVVKDYLETGDEKLRDAAQNAARAAAGAAAQNAARAAAWAAAQNAARTAAWYAAQNTARAAARAAQRKSFNKLVSKAFANKG